MEPFPVPHLLQQSHTYSYEATPPNLFPTSNVTSWDQTFKCMSLCGTFSFRPPHSTSCPPTSHSHSNHPHPEKEKQLTPSKELSKQLCHFTLPLHEGRNWWRTLSVLGVVRMFTVLSFKNFNSIRWWTVSWRLRTISVWPLILRLFWIHLLDYVLTSLLILFLYCKYCQ